MMRPCKFSWSNVLQTEKELQSGGEVKEIMQHVDDLSKKWDILVVNKQHLTK